MAYLDHHYIKRNGLKAKQIYQRPYRATKDPAYPLAAYNSLFYLKAQIFAYSHTSYPWKVNGYMPYLWISIGLVLVTMHLSLRSQIATMLYDFKEVVPFWYNKLWSLSGRKSSFCGIKWPLLMYCFKQFNQLSAHISI